MTTTVSFVDTDGYRGFTLTQIPQISYPTNLPAATASGAPRKGIKLEYLCKGSSEWKESTGMEDKAFLSTVEKVRWTYYDVTSFGKDGKELSLSLIHI